MDECKNGYNIKPNELTLKQMDQQMQQTRIAKHFKDTLEVLQGLNRYNEQDMSYEEEIEQYGKDCEEAVLATARNFNIDKGVVWESIVESILN